MYILCISIEVYYHIINVEVLFIKNYFIYFLEKALKDGAGKKKRISGGKKLNSDELENELLEWILETREKSLRVSRKMIKKKAIELFPGCTDSRNINFRASNGWLDKFLKRNNLSQRRRTTLAQKDPSDMNKKIATFIAYNSMIRKKYKISDNNIIAMDETSAWFDMPSSTTIDQKGKKSIILKSTGHEKMHFTVTLAAKGDGTKLKPYITFKKAIREVRKMESMTDAIVTSSQNGWMNEELTLEWLSKVVGKFSFSKRMLCWDSYKCHISELIKAKVSTYIIYT